MSKSTFWLYLASASPRRRELLHQIGLAHQVIPQQVDESLLPGESPEDYVRRLAVAKAEAGFESLGVGEYLVLGADTAVVCEGRILGKPRDRQDALTMLGLLSGNTHSVFSAVALQAAGKLAVAVVETRVSFRAMSPGECELYWASGEPRDKAGAYGIQGLGALFVRNIEGSYSAVVGLPLYETANLLAEFGIGAEVLMKREAHE